MAYEFRFPDIGEGITEGELLAWKVKEGDIVAEDQTLAEMETDKAVVELPSPRAGRDRPPARGRGRHHQGGRRRGHDRGGRGGPAAAAAEPPAAGRRTGAVGRRLTLRVLPCPYTGSVVGELEEAPDDRRR